MPQIIVKGVSASRMEKLASPLIETVFRLVECPEDWVTVELCESKFFTKEGLTEQYPIIKFGGMNVRRLFRIGLLKNFPNFS